MEGVIRILVAISPRMYREAVALALLNHRPDAEVGIATPKDVRGEIERFRPDVLVRNDDDGLDREALAGVPRWVEVMYTDSMNARIGSGEDVEDVQDIDMDGLLKIVDEAGGRLAPLS